MYTIFIKLFKIIIFFPLVLLFLYTDITFGLGLNNNFIRVFSFGIWIYYFTKSRLVFNKLPWLIFILIEPLIGLILFLLLVREYKVSSKQKEGYNNHFPSFSSDFVNIFKLSSQFGNKIFINNSSFDILKNGSNFYPTLLEKLKEAKHFINMEYYIFVADNIGNEILEVLKSKAREGVEVRLLVDFVGSFLKIKKKDRKSLAKSGVSFKYYSKISSLFDIYKTTYRNHRKITVIDNKVAFTGGINIADKYNKVDLRDTSIMVKGSIVKGLNDIFIGDWYHVTKEKITTDRYNEVISKCNASIITDGAYSKDLVINSIYFKLINSAKKSIKIMTPFLGINRDILTALDVAVKSGVEVSIITPGKPDKLIPYISTKSYYKVLLESGIKVYRYKDVFTHAKILIVDDLIASIGTINLDYRSFYQNSEVSIIFEGENVGKVLDDYSKDLKKCELINKDEWFSRSNSEKIVESIINVFSPLF